jgi:signal transduction histidine kinase
MRLLLLVAAILALGCTFSVSYGAVWLLTQVIGGMPLLLSHVLSALLGMTLCAAWGYIASRSKRARIDGFGRIGQEILDALDRIATGDFSVRISQYGPGPFSDVIASVNKLAADLGTLESQRQDFISNVSHEIQSPLTSISGFAVLLRDDSLTPGERLHYLDIIEAESRRLSKLSDNLLKLTALDDTGLSEGLSDLAAVDISEQLRSAALLLEPQWTDKGLRIELELDDSVTAPGDAELLQQVWVNLLHNAIKYTPEGGQVTVTVRAERGRGALPEAVANPGMVGRAERGRVLVEIADTGIGIASTDLPHIFERFYKADKSRDRSLGGNGLGLALVKLIVELHQGKVTAASEPGLGTTVTVRLLPGKVMGWR